MKHWKNGITEKGYGAAGLLLKDGNLETVLSLKLNERRNIEIREECDCWHVKECSIAEAIEAMQEAIEWLESL